LRVNSIIYHYELAHVLILYSEISDSKYTT
jgi:hypothetical protein